MCEDMRISIWRKCINKLDRSEDKVDALARACGYEFARRGDGTITAAKVIDLDAGGSGSKFLRDEDAK